MRSKPYIERLTTKPKVATVDGFDDDPSILRHSRICGAADEAVPNKVKEKKKKNHTCLVLRIKLDCRVINHAGAAYSQGEHRDTSMEN